MIKEKIIFLDRDGTLIDEPEDKQVDSLEKLIFLPNIIPALLKLKDAGFTFIMVTNQNGIGSESFPTEDFEIPHQKMMDIFASQGITFDDVRICPHFAADNCGCRKPKPGLIQKYVDDTNYKLDTCYFIGDRDTDVELGNYMGAKGIRIGNKGTETWDDIVNYILT